MKAALKKSDGTFEVRDDVEMPKLPKDDWVRARVRVSGICGTDLRHWKVADKNLVGHIVGHELAGEVMEVGPQVRNVQVGDRVVIETLLGDGDCPWCNVKQYNICPHLYDVRVKSVSRAFAEYVVGPAEKFYKLPPNVSFEEATLLDTFAVCLHAQQLSSLHLNEKVLIIGAGPIGLGQLQLAKVSGADVIVTDVVDHSLEVARELGADLVINTAKEDPDEQVRAFTNGRGADVTFECVGGELMPKTLRQATQLTRVGGRVVVVGGFDEDPTSMELDWQRLQKGQIQLILSASYAMWGIDHEMQICLDLVAKGKLNARKLITHTFPLDQINKAFETADAKEKNRSIFVGLLH